MIGVQYHCYLSPVTLISCDLRPQTVKTISFDGKVFLIIFDLLFLTKYRQESN